MDSRELERGRIHSQAHTEYDIWAECGCCGATADGLPSIRHYPGYPNAVGALLQRGWRRTRSYGWTCPACPPTGPQKEEGR